MKCDCNNRKVNLVNKDLTGEIKYEMVTLTSSEIKCQVGNRPKVNVFGYIKVRCINILHHQVVNKM